jgi:hypothetical protein
LCALSSCAMRAAKVEGPAVAFAVACPFLCIPRPERSRTGEESAVSNCYRVLIPIHRKPRHPEQCAQRSRRACSCFGRCLSSCLSFRALSVVERGRNLLLAIGTSETGGNSIHLIKRKTRNLTG